MGTAEALAGLKRNSSTFRLLGWSNLTAQFAEQISLAVAPIVAVLVLGATAADTGFLQTIQVLPFLLLSIPAGIMADRVSKRGLMAMGEAVRGLALLIALSLLLSDQLTLWALALLGFLGATGTVFFGVAAPALVPQIVPDADLTSANRWLELARSAAFIGGPAGGAAILGWAGAPAAYSVAFGLSAVSVLLLLRLREPPAAAKLAPPKVIEDIVQGVRFVFGHALLRPIVLTAVVFNFAWFVLQGVFVAYALNTLHIGTTTLGIILGLNGVGLVVGALAAPVLQSRLPFGLLIALGPICGFLGAGLVLMTLWIPSPILLAAAFTLFGAGPMLWVILTTSIRQIVTPQVMLGRVSAFILTATNGAAPLGAGVGAVVAMTNLEACLWLAFAGFAGQLGIVLCSRLVRQDGLPSAKV